MEHLKIAIADDNQKILDLLDRVIGMEKDMNLVGKAKRCVRSSKINSRMLFFST